MRFAYADPPYPGCAHLYADHPDYAGEVDHAELVARLLADYDGFVLHTSSVALWDLMPLFPRKMRREVRIMPWVKPFCAYKRNVPVAYAWEPCFVRPVRKPVMSGRVVMRDFFSHPMTMRKGLTGAKPPSVVRWLLEVSGLDASDTLDDLYPGTGIVGRVWNEWRARQAGAVLTEAP